MEPTVIVTSDEIDAAYNEMARQVRHKASADRLLFDAEAALRETRNYILRNTDPCELGKNEAIREAKIVEMLVTELKAVKDCEKMQIADREHYELARLQVERIKQKIKLVQTVAGVTE